MFKAIVTSGMALAILAPSAWTRTCDTQDLDGRWQYDALVVGGNHAGFQRCRVTFHNGRATSLSCNDGGTYSPEAFLNYYEESDGPGGVNLTAQMFRSCHFKWNFDTCCDEGFYMRGQMSQSKDVVNGSFDLFWGDHLEGKFTLTRMP